MTRSLFIGARAGLLVVLASGVGLAIHSRPASAWYSGYGHHHGHHHSPFRHGYRGYRYGYYGGYGYRGHYGYAPSYRYRSDGTGEGTYRSAPASADAINDRALTVAASPGTTAQATDGWSLLAAGQHREALRSFGLAAEASPESGQPKAGYAVAAAASGDLSRGVWAMRRAFQVDADGLHYLQVDEALRPSLERVLDAHTPVEDQDDAFMNAALYYLLEAPEAAAQALDRLKALGDDSGSARKLEALIARLVRERPAGGSVAAEGAPG